MEAYIAQRQSELKDTTSIPSIFESTIARTGRGERHGKQISINLHLVLIRRLIYKITTCDVFQEKVPSKTPYNRR